MTVVTDPEIRRELIDTVRRFIAREVIPVASEMEHADEFPAAIVWVLTMPDNDIHP